MPDYEALGVRRVINASARLTRLGGSLMPEPVLAAMVEAARSHVDVFELQDVVGRRLAELTRNEAGFVTTGASAGLFLATLACMVGADLERIARLPDIGDVPNEVIVHCGHRIPYEPAVRLAGARMVQVGNALQTFPWELEAAITERTAAVFWVAGAHLHRGVLPLEETVAIAHAHGVPVIVDAAAQLPPMENLWHFTRDLGADLVVFSGGKDLRGPQASGMILGRAQLIAGCAANDAPHQRLGRPMKVGKEEMMGLLAAVELYVHQDHGARQAAFEEVVQYWLDELNRLPGVVASRSFPNEAGQPVPRVRLQVDPAAAGIDAGGLQAALWDGSPRIAVAPGDDDGVYLTPDTLQPGDERVVAARIARTVASAARQPGPTPRGSSGV